MWITCTCVTPIRRLIRAGQEHLLWLYVPHVTSVYKWSRTTVQYIIIANSQPKQPIFWGLSGVTRIHLMLKDTWHNWHTTAGCSIPPKYIIFHPMCLIGCIAIKHNQSLHSQISHLDPQNVINAWLCRIAVRHAFASIAFIRVHGLVCSEIPPRKYQWSPYLYQQTTLQGFTLYV